MTSATFGTVPRTVACVAGVVLSLGTAAAIAQGATNQPAVHLTCTTQGTHTFTPAITDSSQLVTSQTSGKLDDCTSPDGTQSAIKSGSVTGDASGTASCTGAKGEGTMQVTWYSKPGQTGDVVGTSTIFSTGALKVTVPPDPKGIPGTGTVSDDSSVMPGASSSVLAVPTSIPLCSTLTPLPSLSGTGTVTFAAA